MRELTLGGLRARLTGGEKRDGEGDGPLVVLLHGYGAGGDDLVPLWRVLDVPSHVRFLFPAAPLALDPGGHSRAWWMIDIERIQRAMQGGAVDERIDELPDGLLEARARMQALLDEAERTLGFPRGLYLGGFSQGAMLSLDVALHTEHPLLGVAQLSGTLIARAEWTARMPARKGLRVFQSHGQQDPLLPFNAAERLRDLLRASGLTVEFLSFRGGHQIPDNVLDRLGAFITDGMTPAAP